MNTQKNIRLAMVILGALAFTACASSQVFSTSTPQTTVVFGTVIFMLVNTALSAVLIHRIFWPHLSARLPRVSFAWVGLSLLAGLFLVYTIPLTIYPKNNLLKIIATGEKNPLSQGSEVWLASIAEGDKTSPVPLNTLCRGDWQIVDGLLVSSQNQPSELVCSVRGDKTVSLKFGMHAWSGKVRVIFGSQSTEFDLFSLESSAKSVTYSVSLDPGQNLVRGFLMAADVLTISMLILAAAVWFTYRPLKPVPGSARAAAPWPVYAAGMAISWGIYLLAFWPGFLSPDSLVQLSQATSGKLYDWHPAFHTMTLWLITRAWFSPAAVSIVQIAVLSCLIGWGLSMIQARGAPWWAVWPALLFLALSPSVALMVLTMWKDVAYTIALVGLTLMIFRVIDSGGKQLEKPVFWVGLAVVTALVALYRHNGAPVAVGSLAALAIVYRAQWRPMLMAALLAGALVAGVKGPLYQLARVDTTDIKFSNPQPLPSYAIYLMMSHDRAGTPFLPEEERIYQTLVDPNGGVIPEALAANSADIYSIALRLSLRNPEVTGNYLVKKSAFIFQIGQPALSRYEYVGLHIVENPWGIQSASKLPAVQGVLHRVIRKTEIPLFDWLFWRNAFWMDLMLLAVIVACLRLKTLKYALLIVPVLLNALPLALFSGGQISRYILPTIILAPLFSLFLLTIQPPQETQDRVI